MSRIIANICIDQDAAVGLSFVTGNCVRALLCANSATDCNSIFSRHTVDPSVVFERPACTHQAREKQANPPRCAHRPNEKKLSYGYWSRASTAS